MRQFTICLPTRLKKKFSENKRKLSLYPKNELPQYILNNESKFKEWLD